MTIDSRERDKVDLSSAHRAFKQPHFSFEGDKMIWFGGKSCVLVIDLRTLNQILVDGLLPNVSRTPPEPLNVVADFEKHRILIHYKMENENILVFNELDREPQMRLVGDLFENFNEFECLDISKNKSYAFAGGAKSSLNHVKVELSCKPCIIAFEFNQNLSKICEFYLDKKECSRVLCIRLKGKNEIELREEFNNKDDFKYFDIAFLLTDGPLYVVQFSHEKRNFELLRSINIVGIDGNHPIFLTIFRNKNGFSRHVHLQ